MTVEKNLFQFNPDLTTTVMLSDLSEHALRWAVAKAIDEPIEVEIGEDFRYLHIFCLNRIDDYFGDPICWQPDVRDCMIGELVAKQRLCIGPCDAEGKRWFAQAFANPAVRAEAETLARAVCLASVLQHQGTEVVIVPFQLQHPEQARQIALAEKARIAVELRHDDQVDHYFDIQDSFR